MSASPVKCGHCISKSDWHYQVNRVDISVMKHFILYQLSYFLAEI